MERFFTISKGTINNYIIFIRHLRLIDDSHNIQTSDGSSILSGLALGIIEVGRNSDHSMCNLRKG